MKISLFDLDHTLLKGNSSYHFGYYLYQNRILPKRKALSLITCYGLYYCGLLSPHSLNEIACKRFLHGLSFDEFNAHLSNFIDKHLEKILYHPAVVELNQARQRGEYTVILSSSPSIIVEPIAKWLGADESKGTEYSINSKGQIHSIISHLDGKQKAEYLLNLCSRMKIDIENTTAYSDCITDLPFLKTAGKAKGVNPDKQLKKICLVNNWEII